MIRSGLLRPPRASRWLLLAGILLAAAHPPVRLLVPTFVALVPFFLWLTALPPSARGADEAVRGGFLMGLVYFGLVFYWLFVALVFYSPLALLAYLLPVLIMAGMLGLASLGMHAARVRLGLPLWVGLPVFWTAMEWLRSHLGEVAFPWMRLGETLAPYPWLIGAADVVGAHGITFWVVVVSGLLGELLRRVGPGWMPRELAGGPRREGRGPPETSARGGSRPAGGARLRGSGITAVAVGLLLSLAVPVGYSLYRWRSLETTRAATVAVVQPNVPEDLKMERWAAVDSALTSTATLLRTELRDVRSGLDLVVFPETVLPVWIDPIVALGRRGNPELEGQMAAVARRLGGPVLYGAMGIRNLPDGTFRHFNSAFLVAGTGRRLAAYHKRRLVPMVERVPFVPPEWLQWLTALGPYFGSISPGDLDAPVGLDRASFGTLICYESIFADLSREYRLRGADFLVNVTNDAWYGREEPWWARTSALWQHPAHLVMRAVENRIGVARSANTGISLTVDPLGRTRHRTELFVADAFVAPVHTTEGLTVYSRAGDLTGLLAAVAAASLALAARLRTRRGPGGAL